MEFLFECSIKVVDKLWKTMKVKGRYSPWITSDSDLFKLKPGQNKAKRIPE